MHLICYFIYIYILGSFHLPDYYSQVPLAKPSPNDVALMQKKDALTVLKKRSFAYKGIVCECCENQCSDDELAEYCW